MSFFAPTYRRKRLIAASTISFGWLVVAGLLWALPVGGARRSVTFNRYGILDAWVRYSDYRHNPGKTVGYDVQDGFVLSIVITIVATIVAVGLYFLLSRKWREPGHCIQCNYNLHGNTSGKCPECGQAIKA